MVEKCRNFLLTVEIQVESFDVWLWAPNPDVGYSFDSII